MSPSEIGKRIEAIKSSLDEAFDNGKIDFDAIKSELDDIKAAAIVLQEQPPQPSPGESAAIDPHDFR